MQNHSDAGSFLLTRINGSKILGLSVRAEISVRAERLQLPFSVAGRERAT